MGMHHGRMTRTTIDLDDRLVSVVMARYGLRTKKEAVDLALRRLVGSELTPEFLVGLRGIGWDLVGEPAVADGVAADGCAR